MRLPHELGQHPTVLTLSSTSPQKQPSSTVFAGMVPCTPGEASGWGGEGADVVPRSEWITSGKQQRHSFNTDLVSGLLSCRAVFLLLQAAPGNDHCGLQDVLYITNQVLKLPNASTPKFTPNIFN